MSGIDATVGDWIEVVVRDAASAGRDTLLLQLAPVTGSLPAQAPGAHVALQCGAEMVRHYSLCGVGTAGVYEIAVKLTADTRGGSRWVFDNAKPGAQLRISAPRNHFPLADGEPGYLFLSGGIGITPIIAMLHHLRAASVNARLVHMCPSRGDLAFRDLIDDLAGFHDIHLHFDTEAGGLYDLRAELERAPADTAVYCCGPAPMMAAVQEFGQRAGRADKFHFEFFTPPAIADSTAAAPSKGDEEEDFAVIQGSTGRRIPVPKKKTMLAALRDAGLEMKSECEYGVCGWCVVGVIEGEPRHFDSYLTSSERESNKLVLPCVSRCVTPTLTLDV